MDMDRTQAKQALKAHAFRVRSVGLRRCLAPSNDCDQPAIKAHSVQREGAVRLLSSDGHVIQFRQRLGLDRGPEIRFESVGINRATVFTGLCARHDSLLFHPLEREALDLASPEQLFLFSYRAILRETHVSMEAAARLQSTYQKQCNLGLVDGNVPTRGGMFAVQRLAIAYETWLYKREIDKALLRGDLGAITHDILDLGATGPCVAVSALFSLDDAPIGDDVARVALTVLPTVEGCTYAILGYTSRDATPARRRLRSVLKAPAAKLRYRLSRLILDSTENIVIHPQHFARFPDAKRKTILGFFRATVLTSAPDFEHEHLNLFDVAPA
jgi:hypothetical protein